MADIKYPNIASITRRWVISN